MYLCTYVYILPLQVHGGITKGDIEQFLEKAKKQAEKNRKEKLDTVVFFDEANTTDAIGLIKEIMCDKRLHGKPLPKELHFIAACNPYRRSAYVCLCVYTFLNLSLCVSFLTDIVKT